MTFGEELRNGPLSQHKKNNQWVVWLVVWSVDGLVEVGWDVSVISSV